MRNLDISFSLGGTVAGKEKIHDDSVKLDRDRSCAPGGSMLNVSSSRVIHRVYDIVRKRRNRRHSINTVSGDSHEVHQ